MRVVAANRRLRCYGHIPLMIEISLVWPISLYINAKHGDECVVKSGMSSCQFSSLSDQGSLLESAFTVPNLASFAPRGDAMNFWGKVPDGGSPSFGKAMQAGLPYIPGMQTRNS